MIYLIIFLIPLSLTAQTSYKTITNEALLKKEAMSRTVFIRMYDSSSTDSPVKATGALLKDGYFLTNEHVVRPYLEGKKVAFHIYTNGRSSIHKFEDVDLIDCDKVNDICLLKTSKDYNDAYWTLDSPSFRKISNESPLGLFKGEPIFFNGFCGTFPESKKAKYLNYTSSAYERSVAGLENRKYDTSAIHFSAPDGSSVACGGDSGGPLYDSNLYLYGLVRDSIRFDEGTKKNYAVPLNIIRTFVEKAKASSSSKGKITTIVAFSELEKIFPQK